jgi:hypothetical protein
MAHKAITTPPLLLLLRPFDLSSPCTSTSIFLGEKPPGAGAFGESSRCCIALAHQGHHLSAATAIMAVLDSGRVGPSARRQAAMAEAELRPQGTIRQAHHGHSKVSIPNRKATCKSVHRPNTEFTNQESKRLRGHRAGQGRRRARSRSSPSPSPAVDGGRMPPDPASASREHVPLCARTEESHALMLDCWCPRQQVSLASALLIYNSTFFFLDARTYTSSKQVTST